MRTTMTALALLAISTALTTAGLPALCVAGGEGANKV